jgi:hypothetical protein
MVQHCNANGGMGNTALFRVPISTSIPIHAMLLCLVVQYVRLYPHALSPECVW